MAVHIPAIHARISKLKAEIAELEAALRVIAQFDDRAPTNETQVSSGRPRISHDTATNDLLNKTILECAAEILNTKEEPIHFTAIADEAIARGYESGRETDDPRKSVRQSFWATLKRKPELFEAVGRGRFRLANGYSANHNGGTRK